MVSFQPSSESFGWNDDIVPGDPVEDLHVVQVEVDGVRVHPVVGDLPDLGAVCRRADRGYIDVTLGQVGGVDELRRWVHVMDTG